MILGGKYFFAKNPALLQTTSYVFLTLCQNLEKTIIHFQENAWTDRQADRRMSRPCLIGPFQLPPMVK